MRVLLIGLPGTGKTAMLTSIYGYYQTPRNGLTLRDKNGHTRLMKAYHGILRGTFPEKSIQKAEYAMELFLNAASVCVLNFIDYNGGVFDDNYQMDDEAIAALQKDCAACNGILCLVEAAQFQLANSFLMKTLQTLTAVLMEIQKQTLPVGFVLTKSDLTHKPLTPALYHRVLDPLLNLTAHNRHLQFGVFPVSCVDPLPSLEQPMNFLFLYSAFEKIQEAAASIRHRAEHLMKRSVWDDFKDWAWSRFHGVDTDYEILEFYEQQFEKDKSVIARVVERLEKGLSDAFLVPPLARIEFSQLYHKD